MAAAGGSVSGFPSRLTVKLDRPGFSLDVDFHWQERVAVLFGPSGSGKTTCLEAALGLLPRARSRVQLGGEWLEDCERGLRVPVEARRLGWVPQEPTLFPHRSVAGNLRFALARAGEAGPRGLERAVEVLEIGHLMARRPGELSGGERQRVALARAIASGPRALVLDEPLAALDLPLRSRVLPYLLRVRDELDLPMLYITHDPDEAMLVGETAAVLDCGRLVATGPPREVLWSRAVRPLSEALGLENVLDARAESTPEEGETRIATAGGLRLRVPWQLEPGTAVCIGVRAEDILVARGDPGRISARNVIAGRVSECETDAGEVLVRVDAGETLTARLTPAAVADLGIERGSPVFLVLKAHAIRRIG
jgi:molybdate transport system ATP-binding protein